MQIRTRKPSIDWRPAAACALAAALTSATAVLPGCSRGYYRTWADKETYNILAEREFDPRWDVPKRPVEPSPDSRIAVLADPDCGPLPVDDPAAHRYMHEAGTHGKYHGYKYWHARGDADTSEAFGWLDALERDEQGRVQISRETALDIAVRNSREYQDAIESLYLTALGLTLERFEFDTRWFARTGINYSHFGNSSLPLESNRLSIPTRFGFNRNLVAGGQLLVEFANSLAWEFTANDTSFASSGILVSLTQPLLRGAFRNVRMESLTQSERIVLYELRDFVRFRRRFYVDVVSTYLQLLAQVQSIRNQEDNLEALERNLQEHQELALAGMRAPIQVDQVYQQYQAAQLGLVRDRATLETAQDNYKIQLGLPPDVDIVIDEELLEPFELNSPVLIELQDRIEEFYLLLVQSDVAPPLDEVRQRMESLIELQAQIADQFAEVLAELDQWKSQIQAARDDLPEESDDSRDEDDPSQYELGDERFELAQQQRLADQITKALAESAADFATDQRRSVEALSTLGEASREEAWAILLELTGERLRTTASDAFVGQAQIRVHLLTIQAVDIALDEAIDLALANRLDLMNQRGTVVDAWRGVEVAANALKGSLDATVEADLNTDADKNNPIRFDASANSYRVGLAWDTPIQRLGERNVYRASQIAYQRQRRQLMATTDEIRRAVRFDLRNLRATQLSFNIARQSLVTAARQVEEAQFNLRSQRDADSSPTQDLLRSLDAVLTARDGLVAIWITYQTTRMNLYRDMDVMQIDAQGNWTNEYDDPRTDPIFGCTDVVDGPTLSIDAGAEDLTLPPLEALPPPD